jgi:hypothetical protein
MYNGSHPSVISNHQDRHDSATLNEFECQSTHLLIDLKKSDDLKKLNL